MKLPNHTALGRRLRSAFLAALALSLACAYASPAPAQSLMVGADGAVHLDEFQEGAAAEPVVIEQQPEVIGPSMEGGPIMGDPSMYPPEAYSSEAYPGGGHYHGGVPCPGGPACPMPMAACVQPVTVDCPKPIRHAIFGEFLFLHPTGADVAHAQQQNGTGGAGTVPFGAIGVTDLHYEPGVRVGGDWALSRCTSLGATYTYFESNAASRIDAPVIPGGGGAVGSLVHHPGVGLTSSAGPVDGRSVLDFQLADVDYRALLLNDKCYWLNGTLGARWGHLEQEFGQTGNFSGSSTGVIVTQADVNFDGGGVKFGVDGGRALGTRGFSIYARAGVSPLVGEFRSSYHMRNDTVGVALAQANWNDDRFVTLLDYEVGFAWTGQRRRWRFATGYTASFWYNALTTPEFIGAVQTGDYTDASDTISFDGVTARIERMW
jgi:hypothetical protein